MIIDPHRFEPAWWLRSRHGQTIGARILRPKGGLSFRRERWTTPDDDFLDLDFVEGAGLREDVLVVVLHGLEGSARSGYARQLYRCFRARGIAAVGLNFRSCSGELNRGNRLYHSGETTDLAFVIDRLRRDDPRRRLVAVGVSLGGNVMLKYLGERGPGARLDAAAAWSVPFDLGAGARYMESGLPALYVRRLLRSLKSKVRARAVEFGDRIDVAGALGARTFREFDDAATAPLHGFRDADDYYARSSSAAFLGSISVPTLVLHSRDDPFLPADAVPTVVLDASFAIEPIITVRGGHVGYLAGRSPLSPVFWAEEVIADWVVEMVRSEV